MLNFNHVYYFHVALLERALEVSLFERTGSGLRLTEEGRAVYIHTTTMFRAAELIIETVGKSPPDRLPILRRPTRC